jgi:hypothetical protein
LFQLNKFNFLLEKFATISSHGVVHVKGRTVIRTYAGSGMASAQSITTSITRAALVLASLLVFAIPATHTSGELSHLR